MPWINPIAASRVDPIAPPYSPEVQAVFSKIMPPGVPPLTLFTTLARVPRIYDRFRAGSLLDWPFSMYNVAFNYMWQNFAANDFLVLYVNPRGSTGYGSAFSGANRCKRSESADIPTEKRTEGSMDSAARS